MNQIPPLGWAAIAVIVIVTVVINLGLIAMLRNPQQMRNLKMPKNSRSGLDLKKTVDTLRDPFKDERNQLNELSHLVQGLKKTPGSPAEPDRPAENQRKQAD